MPPPAGDLTGQEWALRSNLLRRPEDAESMAKLAAVVAQQGRTGEAIELLQRALGHAPEDHSMRLNLVQLLQRHGDVEGAVAQISLINGRVRSTFEVQTIEAGLLGILGLHRPQVAIYRKLLRKHPRDPRLWDRLGNALKYDGQAAAAIQALRRAVSVQPTHGEAWWSLANVKTYRFDSAEIAVMRQALDGKLNAFDALHIHFALGKALEERGEFEESFRHYAEGNRIRAAGFTPEQMDMSRVAGFVDEAIDAYDRPLFDGREGAGHSAGDPIFVVGLQRSGSTLIEQILASHPLIEGLSEPDSMLHIWTGLDRSALRSGRTVWQEIRDLDPQRLHDIGADYLERSRPFRKTDRPFFVDKRPSNWMYAGLIRLALPKARMIDARRHPMACGFSNFKQLYAAGGLPFSYSLEPIGRYYVEYLRFMDHLDQVQPGSIHHLLNESLIADPELEIRRLLDFVGVPFDPACLEFHKTKRAVTTASAEQVRRPINRDGLDKWRHYEPWLDPLKKALGPALESWATISS